MIKKRAMSNSRAYPNLDMHDNAPAFMVMDRAIVDGEPWYTIRCLKPTANWIRDTYPDNNELWHEHIDDSWHIYRLRFDVSEKMLALLTLRWE